MHQEPSDEHLLQQFNAGNHDALGALAARYEQPLLGLAQGVLGGPAHADIARDAVQDAWVRLIRSAHQFSGRSTVRTWLYRIVINRCRDLRAARSIRADRERSVDPPALSGPLDTSTSLSSAPPAAELDESRRRLHAAVERLPDAVRLAVLLCYHRSLTNEQAAEILAIPVGTLKTRLRTGLTRLRAELALEVQA